MNTEKLKGVWEKIKTTLGKVSKKIWILIAAIVVVVIVGLVVYFNTRPYSTLITGATAEEMSTVRTWLQDQNVTDYRIQGSDTILVPASQAVSLKAALLQEQYSDSNSGFNSYFERVGALSTIRDRDAAWLVTLMEDMERTIRQFPGVRDVDVKIDPGQDNGYVLDTGNKVEASASVFLFMQPNKTLDEGQVNAIRYYVSHAVAGLDVDNVSINDSNGTIYEDFGGGGTSAADASALKLQVEQYWKHRIETSVEDMLGKTFGKENVAVSANCTAELGDKTINDYHVHLPDFGDDSPNDGTGVIGNRFYSYQFRVDNETAVGGVVGTATNSNLPTYVEEGETLQEALGRLVGEGSIEYDNSKTQTQMIITAATLTDVTLAVSINSTTATADGPLDQEQLVHHVAIAAGIQAPLELPEGITEDDYLSRKVSVLLTPFWREPEPEPEPGILDMLETIGIPSWVVIAAIAGLLLFAILLTTILLLLRRRKRKKNAEEQKAIDELLSTAMPGQTTVVIGADGQPVTVGPDGQPVEVSVELDENGNPVSGADVMELHTERSMELRQSIRDFVDENMEVAALLIKSWLKEDGDNG